MYVRQRLRGHHRHLPGHARRVGPWATRWPSGSATLDGLGCNQLLHVNTADVFTTGVTTTGTTDLSVTVACGNVNSTGTVTAPQLYASNTPAGPA